MKAHIERIPWPVGIIRVGPDGWRFGDPHYLAACNMIFSDPFPEVAALATTPTGDMRRAVEAEMAALGIARAFYKHYGPDGLWHHYWLKARKQR